MRRLPLAIVAASTLVAAALPATAAATEIQLGQTATALAAPTCPNNQANAACTIVLYRMTALQTVGDGTRNPTVVTQPGVVSSFSVGISGITSDQSTRQTIIAAEDKEWGGAPSVELTVLRPTVGRPGSAKTYEVASQSPIQPLQSYLGSVVQFPLLQGLPVVPGEVVALTSPTWAPVLSINLSTSNFGYVQSRTGNCNNTSQLPSYVNPQLDIGQTETYGCSYTGTRVEYSATETTTPTVTAAYRLAARTHLAGSPRRLR